MNRTAPARRQRDAELSTMRRIAAASLIGTTIEWYDFFLYATMAALIFNRVFFPSLDDSAGTLASFATFGAGFIARPVGGLLMGHFGDRVGRKSALVTSLVLMGGATFAIGLIPTYNSIGLAAPAILVVLRFVQGFALGGEWGGAVTLSMEHAPEGRRGWWAAWVQYGALGGILLSSGTVLVLSEFLTDRQFVTWGWRVPFLASGLLLAVGLFVRLRIEESPVFQELDANTDRRRLPAFEAVRHHGWTMIRVCGMHLVVAAFVTTLMTFYISYGVTRAGFSRTEMLQVVFLGTLVTASIAPFLGNLSDRFGRRRIYLIGCALAMAGVFPSFLLVDTGEILPGIAGIMCLGLPVAITYQVQGAYFPELFPAQARVTGAGLGAQLATVAVGGPAPVIAQSLLRHGDGRPWLVATYLMAVAFVSLLSAAVTPDRRPPREVSAPDSEDAPARWAAARVPTRTAAAIPTTVSPTSPSRTTERI